MPRPYRMGQRQVAADQTRARILAATRELIMASDGFARFSIDAVARHADVARMTIYYQFGSRIGLLEALCDTLGAQGGMQQLATAFQQPTAIGALDTAIAVFSHFWDSDRLVTRRLRGLAALDPDFEQVIRARDERRRRALGMIVGRFVEDAHGPATRSLEEQVNVLVAVTSFEFFDMLADPIRTCQEVAPIVRDLARAALGLSD